MIRLDNISKQNGHQILFIEAVEWACSAARRLGSSAPNGAGKTTLFRMITGEEDQPDEGQVADRCRGHDRLFQPGCRRNVRPQRRGRGDGRRRPGQRAGGRTGRAGGWPWARSAPDDDFEAIVARYGEVQGRYEELDGYALEGKRAGGARGPEFFSEERMNGDVGALSGGWKMRVALARILLMRPDCHAARRAEQPSRSRKPHLARRISSKAMTARC